MAYTVFRIPVGYRLYDREINKIVSLNEGEFLALERIQKNEGTPDDQIVLQEMQSKGLCQKGLLKKIEHPGIQTLEVALKKRLQQMVLQVTQNCNLRCSYCAYSGSYNNRKHSNKRMSKAVAFRAVDFFMKHSVDVDDVTVGFYGGEPLLEFELIKDVVEYVEKEYPERNVQFNLTTNLTLLTPEMIDFFVKNNIVILISIDGPKDIQDRNRVFVNGKGSFSVVERKAKEIRNRHQDYFKTCMTNTVMTPSCDYKKVIDFLDNSEVFGKLNSMYTLVNDTDIKEPLKYDDGYNQTARKEMFKVFLAMVGEIDYSQVSRLMKGNMSTIVEMDQHLQVDGTEKTEKSHPGGPCVPGSKRLFIDVDGNFYPCERIAEYPNLQIGNLDTGYQFEKIEEMLNVGKMTEQQCLDCWAFIYCGTCVANMTDFGRPSREIRLQKCATCRSSALNRLADHEIMKYYGFNFMEGRD